MAVFLSYFLLFNSPIKTIGAKVLFQSDPDIHRKGTLSGSQHAQGIDFHFGNGFTLISKAAEFDQGIDHRLPVRNRNTAETV